MGHHGDGGSLLPSVALSLQAVETGESRGPDNFGRRGPQRRGARVPRPATTELGEHLVAAGPHRSKGAFNHLGWSSQSHCSILNPPQPQQGAL